MTKEMTGKAANLLYMFFDSLFRHSVLIILVLATGVDFDNIIL